MISLLICDLYQYSGPAIFCQYSTFGIYELQSVILMYMMKKFHWFLKYAYCMNDVYKPYSNKHMVINGHACLQLDSI